MGDPTEIDERSSTPRSAVRSFARDFSIVYAAVAATFVAVGASAYFGSPMYESGDFAANALQIERAKEGTEILGNYSRFGFHHPGPAFFYVYAIGEILFHDVLGAVPAELNAHLLAGVLLQAGFLALGVVVLSSLAPHRWTFIVSALAVALIVLSLAENFAFTIWPPAQIVMPFFCFLAAALAVAMGRVSFLPVAVLCGGFLIHGHVAQPLFVGPIFVAAYGSFLVGVWRARVRVVDALACSIRSHLWAVAAALPFAVPLIIDLLQPQSNLGLIRQYLEADQPTATWGRGLFHVLSFVVFRDQPPDGVFEVVPAERFAFLANNGLVLGAWIIVLAASAALLWSGRTARTAPDVPAHGASQKRFVLVYFGLLALVLSLTVFWGKSQYGPLYVFNTYFFNSAILLAALAPAFVLAQRPVLESSALLTGGIAAVIAVAAVIAAPWGPPPPNASAAELHQSATRFIADYGADEPVLLEFEESEWAQASALALVLDRHGVEFLVAPHWGFMLGYEHVYPGSTLISSNETPERWVLGNPDTAPQVEVRFNDHLALVSVVENVRAP